MEKKNHCHEHIAFSENNSQPPFHYIPNCFIFFTKKKTCMDMHNEDIACHTIEKKLSTRPQMSAPQRITHYGKWVALNQLKILLLMVHT
jgi:hypothetical protein